MGSRRLPHPKALKLALMVSAALACAGCSGRGDDERVVPTARAAISPTATAPAPTATPDLLGPPPSSVSEAQQGVTRALARSGTDGCPPSLQIRWLVACTSGDLDGDSKADIAYLVPLAIPSHPGSPAIVFVRRSSGLALDRFPSRGEADASIFGRALFQVSERTGGGRPELVLLENSCGQSGCQSRVLIQQWDGTTWRDIGPGEGIDSLDSVTLEGSGASSKLTMHGGIVIASGAGPQRAFTSTYTFDGARYALHSRLFDSTVYLVHAMADADSLFAEAKWGEAISAYAAAIASTTLVDWFPEAGKPEGRTTLVGYMLLRIAIAEAARGANPDPALDRVITASKDALFVNAAEAFRAGFQLETGVHSACLGVTAYLQNEAIAAYIRERFDYGFMNYPIKTARDICPL